MINRNEEIKRTRNNNHSEFCTVPGCNRKYESKGYCHYHYIDARRKGFISTEKCKVGNCNVGVYAKGYCHKHYVQFKNNGPDLYQRHICKAEGCTKKIIKGEYCKYHQIRVDAGMPLNATHFELFGGARNPRWHGGNSEYKNHYIMKKIRKEIFKERGGKCEFCGAEGKEIHHKNHDKSDHRKENFVLCCTKCHKGIFHHQPRMNTKYNRLYGMNIYKIAEQLNISTNMVSQYHKQGILKDKLRGELVYADT